MRTERLCNIDNFNKSEFSNLEHEQLTIQMIMTSNDNIQLYSNTADHTVIQLKRDHLYYLSFSIVLYTIMLLCWF